VCVDQQPEGLGKTKFSTSF